MLSPAAGVRARRRLFGGEAANTPSQTCRLSGLHCPREWDSSSRIWNTITVRWCGSTTTRGTAEQWIKGCDRKAGTGRQKADQGVGEGEGCARKSQTRGGLPILHFAAGRRSKRAKALRRKRLLAVGSKRSDWHILNRTGKPKNGNRLKALFRGHKVQLRSVPCPH